MAENEKWRQYVDALSGGDLNEVLRLRKMGVTVAESPDDFPRMLASLIEDRPLGELKSRQINPDALVRYVRLAEVVEKCGPLIEVCATCSIGPRPSGWGSLVNARQVLSWLDEGFGLVGDQAINVDIRYVTKHPLTDFEDTIIMGPMEDDFLDDGVFKGFPVMWEGEVLESENLDTETFRSIFLLRQAAHKCIEWGQDYEFNAYVDEAFRHCVTSPTAGENIETLSAMATLKALSGDLSQESSFRDELDEILGLNPNLKDFVKVTKAVWDWAITEEEDMQREAVKRVQGLNSKDEKIAAIADLLALLDEENSDIESIEAVDAYCSFKSLMRDLDSPYLSWMIEDLCHRLLVTAAIHHLEDEAEGQIYENLLKLIENGLYFSPVHLLLKALLNNELPILESMIDKNVCVRGHVMNGNVFVPLATALMKGTVPMVRALCENGADPLEKSHYLGWDGFECLLSRVWDEIDENKSQQEEFPTGDEARIELRGLADKGEMSPELQEMTEMLFKAMDRREVASRNSSSDA